jgi:putative transposase
MKRMHPGGVPESSVASTYLSLHVHVIFATKDRAPTIATAWREELHSYIGGTTRGLGAKPLAVGGVGDHVHVLVGLAATQDIADFVREVKKASSVWAAERSPRFSWQIGYAALSVSPSELARVSAYIATQEEHHKTTSSADELRAILEEAGIEIDVRFFE